MSTTRRQRWVLFLLTIGVTLGLTACGEVRGAARPLLEDATHSGEGAAAQLRDYEEDHSGVAKALSAARDDVARYVANRAIETLCGAPANYLQTEHPPTIESLLDDFAADTASDGVAGDAALVKGLWERVESGDTSRAYAIYKTQEFASAYCPTLDD